MIRLECITKTFPGVKSLNNVSFEAVAGEIHALAGENGAGKSTLIKIIAGAYTPDEGAIFFDGKERSWNNPGEAKDTGIHIIYQELMLFSELSVAENIFINATPRSSLGFIDYKSMFEGANEILDKLGHNLDSRKLVKDLSIADQQMVEIAKALVGETKLLILDEPTAVISGREAELLFERIQLLRDEGVCVIYISHRLEEIFSLANRVTVLKDGEYVATCNISELNRDRLVAMMVGRELKGLFPSKNRPPNNNEPLLTVRNLQSLPKVKEVSFDIYAGEILGLSGLIGSGRSEVAHAVFGSLPRSNGEVVLDGNIYDESSPRDSIDRGLGFLTEDRKGEGLMLDLNLSSNITAPKLREYTTLWGVDKKQETHAAEAEINRLQIAVPSPKFGVRKLSGGNQQKVLFGRWTRACQKVLILDEPTRGVDVGAKAEIYQIIRELADKGLALLVISSELPEIIGLCTRVLVMREGVITGEVSGGNINEESIMKFATATA